MNVPHRRADRPGFTLIELLTVVAIISLLISILMPSLGRARDQAKRAHCLARLKDFGNAIGAYENDSRDLLPPALWIKHYPTDPDSRMGVYGWTEILWSFVYKEELFVEDDLPVQRNVDPDRFEEYFICRASSIRGVNSGHYRVYLPSWSAGSYGIEPDGTFGFDTEPDPWLSTSRSAIRPRMPLIGDANELSRRTIGPSLEDMCSYIGPGEANEAGTDGRNGNRFSDRHSGGSNYLFQDLHGEWEPRLHEKLAVDWDLNGIDDIDVVP